MAQISSTTIQASLATHADTEAHDDGVVFAFKELADKWRKKRGLGGKTDADQALVTAMPQELARTALQCKASTGHAGDGQPGQIVNKQAQALSATSRAIASRVGMKSGADGKGADGMGADKPGKSVNRTKVDAHAAVVTKTKEESREVGMRAPATSVATVASAPNAGSGMATGMEAVETMPSEFVDPKKPVRPEPNQSASPREGQHAQSMPATDMRHGQGTEFQNGRAASQSPFEQFVAFRQPALTPQALQDGASRGSELTYRFNKWGNEHSVKVQSQSRVDVPQLMLQPSDSLVAQRLGEHLSQTSPPGNWTVLEDGKQREERRAPEQIDDEEDAP